jgi:hypothetical protein
MGGATCPAEAHQREGGSETHHPAKVKAMGFAIAQPILPTAATQLRFAVPRLQSFNDERRQSAARAGGVS